MEPLEIAKGIYSVGVTDWNIRDFHGYSTHRGTTYNAFLIVDEKNILVDTVKKEFSGQLLDHISQIIDPKKIDIVVSNHSEMDHSGGLPRIMHKIGEDKPIYCSKMGFKNLSSHFTQQWHYHPVENNETLSIGKRTLTFLETRMLHWPDSMFTYVKEDKLLFSSDAFGQHYAGVEAFDDQLGDAVMLHAKKYFANILMLYGAKILKLIEKIQELGLEFDMICPDHGVFWRKNIGSIIEAYGKWGRQDSEKKAVVIYDTMWHSTETMANAIVSGLASEGVPATPIHIRSSHRSDIITEILDAKAVIVGSPTLNNQMFPTVADVLTYIKGLKPKNKIGAAFGSYGWSGEAVRLINTELEAMKFDIIDAGLKLQYVPDGDGVKACYEFGRNIARAM